MADKKQQTPLTPLTTSDLINSVVPQVAPPPTMGLDAALQKAQNNALTDKTASTFLANEKKNADIMTLQYQKIAKQEAEKQRAIEAEKRRQSNTAEQLAKREIDLYPEEYAKKLFNEFIASLSTKLTSDATADEKQAELNEWLKSGVRSSLLTLSTSTARAVQNAISSLADAWIANNSKSGDPTKPMNPPDTRGIFQKGIDAISDGVDAVVSFGESVGRSAGAAINSIGTIAPSANVSSITRTLNKLQNSSSIDNDIKLYADRFGISINARKSAIPSESGIQANTIEYTGELTPDQRQQLIAKLREDAGLSADKAKAINEYSKQILDNSTTEARRVRKLQQKVDQDSGKYTQYENELKDSYSNLGFVGDILASGQTFLQKVADNPSIVGGESIGSILPAVAVGVATAGAGAVASGIATAVANVGLTAGDAGTSARESVLSTPDQDFINNPESQPYLLASGGSVSLAKKLAAEDAAVSSSLLSVPIALAGSGVLGKSTAGAERLGLDLANRATRLSANRVTPTAVNKVVESSVTRATDKALELGLSGAAVRAVASKVRSIAVDAVSEGVEEASTTLASNYAARNAGSNVNLTDGLGEAFAVGGLVGGAFGSVTEVVSYIAERNAKQADGSIKPSTDDGKPDNSGDILLQSLPVKARLDAINETVVDNVISEVNTNYSTNSASRADQFVAAFQKAIDDNSSTVEGGTTSSLVTSVIDSPIFSAALSSFSEVEQQNIARRIADANGITPSLLPNKFKGRIGAQYTTDDIAYNSVRNVINNNSDTDPEKRSELVRAEINRIYKDFSNANLGNIHPSTLRGIAELAYRNGIEPLGGYTKDTIGLAALEINDILYKNRNDSITTRFDDVAKYTRNLLASDGGATEGLRDTLASLLDRVMSKKDIEELFSSDNGGNPNGGQRVSQIPVNNGNIVEGGSTVDATGASTVDIENSRGRTQAEPIGNATPADIPNQVTENTPTAVGAVSTTETVESGGQGVTNTTDTGQTTAGTGTSPSAEVSGSEQPNIDAQPIVKKKPATKRRTASQLLDDPVKKAVAKKSYTELSKKAVIPLVSSVKSTSVKNKIVESTKKLSPEDTEALSHFLVSEVDLTGNATPIEDVLFDEVRNKILFPETKLEDESVDGLFADIASSTLGIMTEDDVRDLVSDADPVIVEPSLDQTINVDEDVDPFIGVIEELPLPDINNNPIQVRPIDDRPDLRSKAVQQARITYQPSLERPPIVTPASAEPDDILTADILNAVYNPPEPSDNIKDIDSDILLHIEDVRDGLKIIRKHRKEAPDSKGMPSMDTQMFYKSVIRLLNGLIVPATVSLISPLFTTTSKGLIKPSVKLNKVIDNIILGSKKLNESQSYKTDPYASAAYTILRALERKDFNPLLKEYAIINNATTSSFEGSDSDEVKLAKIKAQILDKNTTKLNNIQRLFRPLIKDGVLNLPKIYSFINDYGQSIITDKAIRNKVNTSEVKKDIPRLVLRSVLDGTYLNSFDRTNPVEVTVTGIARSLAMDFNPDAIVIADTLRDPNSGSEDILQDMFSNANISDTAKTAGIDVRALSLAISKVNEGLKADDTLSAQIADVFNRIDSVDYNTYVKSIVIGRNIANTFDTNINKAKEDTPITDVFSTSIGKFSFSNSLALVGLAVSRNYPEVDTVNNILVETTVDETSYAERNRWDTASFGSKLTQLAEGVSEHRFASIALMPKIDTQLTRLRGAIAEYGKALSASEDGTVSNSLTDSLRIPLTKVIDSVFSDVYQGELGTLFTVIGKDKVPTSAGKQLIKSLITQSNPKKYAEVTNKLKSNKPVSKFTKAANITHRLLLAQDSVNLNQGVSLLQFALKHNAPLSIVYKDGSYSAKAEELQTFVRQRDQRIHLALRKILLPFYKKGSVNLAEFRKFITTMFNSDIISKDKKPSEMPIELPRLVVDKLLTGAYEGREPTHKVDLAAHYLANALIYDINVDAPELARQLLAGNSTVSGGLQALLSNQTSEEYISIVADKANIPVPLLKRAVNEFNLIVTNSNAAHKAVSDAMRSTESSKYANYLGTMAQARLTVNYYNKQLNEGKTVDEAATIAFGNKIDVIKKGRGNFLAKLVAIIALAVSASAKAAVGVYMGAVVALSSPGGATLDVTTITKEVGVSRSVSAVKEYVKQNNDNLQRGYIIADKKVGAIYIFDSGHNLVSSTPALFGQSRSDTIDTNKATPAGKFALTLYKSDNTKLYGDTVQGFKSTDKATYAIHRLLNIKGEGRAERIQSDNPNDNNITNGCINVPANFYDKYLNTDFSGAIYILPENKSVEAYLADLDNPRPVKQKSKPIEDIKANVGNVSIPEIGLPNNTYVSDVSDVVKALEGGTNERISTASKQILENINTVPKELDTQPQIVAKQPTLKAVVGEGLVDTNTKVSTIEPVSPDDGVHFAIKGVAIFAGLYGLRRLLNRRRRTKPNVKNIEGVTYLVPTDGYESNKELTIVDNLTKATNEKPTQYLSDIPAYKDSIVSSRNLTEGERESLNALVEETGATAYTLKYHQNVFASLLETLDPSFNTILYTDMKRVAKQQLTKKETITYEGLQGQTFSTNTTIGKRIAPFYRSIGGQLPFLSDFLGRIGIARTGVGRQSYRLVSAMLGFRGRKSRISSSLVRENIDPVLGKLMEILDPKDIASAGGTEQALTIIGNYAMALHVVEEAHVAFMENLYATRAVLVSMLKVPKDSDKLTASYIRKQARVDKISTQIRDTEAAIEGATTKNTPIPGGLSKPNAEKLIQTALAYFPKDVLDASRGILVKAYQDINLKAVEAGTLSADTFTYYQTHLPNYVPLYKPTEDAIRDRKRLVDSNGNAITVEYEEQTDYEEVFESVLTPEEIEEVDRSFKQYGLLPSLTGLGKIFNAYGRSGSRTVAGDAVSNLYTFVDRNSSDMAGVETRASMQDILDTITRDIPKDQDMWDKVEAKYKILVSTTRPTYPPYIKMNVRNTEGRLTPRFVSFTAPEVKREIQSLSYYVDKEQNKILKYMAVATRTISKALIVAKPLTLTTLYIKDIMTRTVQVAARDVVDAKGNPVSPQKVLGRYTARILEVNATIPKVGKTPEDSSAFSDIYRILTGDKAISKYADHLNYLAEQGIIVGIYENLGSKRDTMLENIDSLRSLRKDEGTYKIKKKLKRRFRDAYIHGFVEGLPHLNTLATYMAFVDVGVPKNEAANLVRNLFNPMANSGFLQWTSIFYGFIRSIGQGSVNLVETLRTKRGAIIMGAATVLGLMLISSLDELWGDDEDGNSKLFKLGLGAFERGIPLPVNGGEDAWYIPIGFGETKVAWMTAVSSFRAAKGVISTPQALGEIAMAHLAEAKPFPSATISLFKENPLAFALQTVLPTFARPLGSIATNLNAFGTPIHNEFSPYGKRNADQGRANTPEWIKDIAKALNPHVDLYPETIGFLIKEYGFGLGEFVKVALDDKGEKTGGYSDTEAGVLWGAFNALGGSALHTPYSEAVEKVEYQFYADAEDAIKYYDIKLTDPNNRGKKGSAEAFIKQQLLDKDVPLEEQQLILNALGLQKEMKKAKKSLKAAIDDTVKKQQLGEYTGEQAQDMLNVIHENNDTIRDALIQTYIPDEEEIDNN